MKRVTKIPSKGKKKVLGEVNIITTEEYSQQDLNSKVELIRHLIPLVLILIHQMLQEEVEQLVGERYNRDKTNPHLLRYGSNPGSIKVGGQRYPIKVPRVRDRSTQTQRFIDWDCFPYWESV